MSGAPGRHVGYVTVDEQGHRMQREVSLELKHWRTFYEAMVADADPSALADLVCAQALASSPNDLEAGLAQVLENWDAPWPARLGQVI